MDDYIRSGRLMAAVIANHPILVNIESVGKNRITVSDLECVSRSCKN
jgi:hypothetical protein